MNWNRFITKTHKWFGLVLALQFFGWLSGGVVMSVLDLDEVHGDFTRAQHEIPQLSAVGPLYPMQDVLARAHGATEITLGWMMDRPVYRLSGGQGTLLVDAQSGEVLSPISAELAAAIAAWDYNGDASTASEPFLMNEHEVGYLSGKLPVWRVNMNDETDLRLYISREAGRVVARRNDVWRLFDFFWMLHIMDYENRDDFNTWWLRSFAISAFLFFITGLVLLYYRLRPSKNRRRL